MSYGWQKTPREDPGAPPGGLRRLKKTEAPEAELEDEAAALPPASSSSPASPLRPPEEIKPPARGACRAEEEPGFPPSIADGGRKPEAEGGRRWSADFRCPLSLLIKGRSGDAAASLLQ